MDLTKLLYTSIIIYRNNNRNLKKTHMEKRNKGDAPPLAMQHIYRSQLVKLENDYKHIWSKMPFVCEGTKPFLRTNKKTIEIRKIALTNLGFLESFVFFYVDGTAQIVLISPERGSAVFVQLIKDSALMESPLRIDVDQVGEIFYKEGLELFDEPIKYRKIMQLLDQYFQYVKNNNK